MRLALKLELCLLRLLSSPAPGGGGARSTCAGFQPESWPQGQTDKRTPFTAPPQLADVPDADVAAGVGSDERDQQMRKSVRQNAEAPEF